MLTVLNKFSVTAQEPRKQNKLPFFNFLNNEKNYANYSSNNYS